MIQLYQRTSEIDVTGITPENTAEEALSEGGTPWG